MQFKKDGTPRFEFFILNSSLTVFFILIAMFSPFRPTDALLLYSPDSQEYFSCGIEFYDLSQTGTSFTRPFLFSTILRVLHSIGGTWLVVIFHFLCWCLSANFIYFGLKRRFSNKWIRYISVTIFAFNLSLIGYSFAGLTEVISALILSIIAYITIIKTDRIFDVKYFLQIVLLLSLLSVIKPLFWVPLVVFICVGGIVVVKKLIQFKYLLILLASLSPVVFQSVVMKLKYNTFKLSKIDTLTFDNYLLAQGIREIDGVVNIAESQAIAKSLNSDEKRAYLWNNKTTYLRLYFTNITENVDAYESNFLYPNYTIGRYYDFMDSYNSKFFWVSLVFVIGFIWLFIVYLFKGKILNHWQMFFLGLLFYYIVFASGISFWQADRLIVFSIPLWIITYNLLLSQSNISNFILGKKQ